MRATTRVLAAAVPVLLTSAVALGAGPLDLQTYDTLGTAVSGVRPTAMGLPRLGGSGTVGAGELVPALRTYHDGPYAADLKAVGDAASAYLTSRLAGTPASCAGKRFARVKRKPGRKALYRKVSVCTPAVAAPAKPAIVLDIDETSLSNYDQLAAAGFTSAGLATAAISGADPAIAPTLALYDLARSKGVTVFFVTGRPAALNTQTNANLKSAGYDQGYEPIQNKPSDQGTVQFKSGARAAIEAQGYDVILNMGDQESDLTGGHADQAFKLPNPFYVIYD